MIKFYKLFLLVLLICSCNNEKKVSTEITSINLDFKIERFDSLFNKATKNSLQKLKNTYPFLFNKNITDDIWISKMNDSIQKVLRNEVQNSYASNHLLKQELELFFQHLKYYDKTFEVPRIITVTNDIDYRNNVIANADLLLIALDNFLGSEHEFYQNFPKYIAQNQKPEQILPNIASRYANKYMFQQQRKSFIDEMIFFGKKLYFKDIMLPLVPDEEKIGYTKEDLKWAEENESAVWTYFIEKELLFSTDSKLVSRFIANAPFSKFYLELDNDTPGRIGQYIGWQIVKAYAENNNVNVLEVLQTEPEIIFNKSKFKPKK